MGMRKHAAERSGSKYVIGRDGWKIMKLMYGCGALAWYQRESDDLEVLQNGFGSWLWEVGKVRPELVFKISVVLFYSFHVCIMVGLLTFYWIDFWICLCSYNFINRRKVFACNL